MVTPADLHVLAVLKGVVDHGDGAAYFGSLGAYEYHRDQEVTVMDCHETPNECCDCFHFRRAEYTDIIVCKTLIAIRESGVLCPSGRPECCCVESCRDLNAVYREAPAWCGSFEERWVKGKTRD